MMLLTALFVVGLLCLPACGQVTFQKPVANEVISGGVPFTVTCLESTSAPYFSQMSNFSMLLFAGSYSSPQVLYAWDLDSTPPSTVSNAITIPRSIGPSASSAYFFGMSGWITLNSSISVTYFSPKFSLQNMTGSTSLIPSSTSSASTSTSTASAGRLIVCENANGNDTIGETGGLSGIINQACELAALAVISLLALATTSTSTTTSHASTATPVTTSPPDMTGYAPIISASASTTRSVAAVATGSSATSNLQSQSTASSATGSSGTTSTSSRQNSKMVYCLIIAGLSLATVIALFWIWRRYKTLETYCDHADCAHSKWRKKYDKLFRRVPAKKMVDVDTEKGPIGDSTVAIVPINQRGLETENDAEIEAAAVAAAAAAAAAATRRQRFEEMMGNRASRRASRKTIVAELEGDLGAGAEEPLPVAPMPIDFESRDTVPDLDAAKRKTVVGQGQQGMVVKGRDAAIIVRVGKQGSMGHGTNSSRVVSESDLPLIPVHRTSDDEDIGHILSILYVKGENDDDDDEDNKMNSKAVDETKTDQKTEDARIREMRKKKLRHRRNQLSIQIPTREQVGPEVSDPRTAP